jgi:hypothetical protein
MNTTTDTTELHGAALIAELLRRKQAAADADVGQRRARLAADVRVPQAREKFETFRAETDEDLLAWAQLDVDAARRLGLAGVDLVAQLQAGAVALRQFVAGYQAKLAELPTRAAVATLDTEGGILNDLLEIESAAKQLWGEYRRLRALMEQWETEYTTA